MGSAPERQLEIVYQQMARTAGFRGFRPPFLFAVSAVSVAATAVALLLSGVLTVQGMALFWICVAVALAAVVFLVVIRPALRDSSTVAAETGRCVLIQLLPCGAVAAVMTAAILLRFPEAVPYLPSVWLVLFGLGVAALSPLLLAQVEYASIVYFAGAAVAFLAAGDRPFAFALTVGIPFAAGHLLTGLLIRSAELLANRRTNNE